jgi:hypothetical protein
VYAFVRDYVSSLAPNILGTVAKMLRQNITETVIGRKFFIVGNLMFAFFWDMRVNE